MSAIMVASKSVTAQTIETTKVSTAPRDQISGGGIIQGIAINTITNKIYVLSYPRSGVGVGNGTVSVIDSNSGEVKSITVGNGHGTCLHCIGVDESNNKIYVANNYGNTVSVINGTDGTVKSVTVGHGPTFIAVSEFTSRVYVVNKYEDTVSVINGANDTVMKQRIPVGYYPIYMLPPRFPLSKAYVLNGDDTVSVINVTDNTVINDKILLTCYGLLHDTETYKTFRLLGNNTLLMTRLVPTILPVCYNQTQGQIPYSSMAYGPDDLPWKIYVAGNKTVSVVNGTDDAVTKQKIPVGEYPKLILFSYFLPKANKDYTYPSFSSKTSYTYPRSFIPGGLLIKKAYVVNAPVRRLNLRHNPDTISVINPINDTNEQTITLAPNATIGGIVSDPVASKIYVSNSNSSTVSVFDVSNQSMNDTKEKYIVVGNRPGPIAFNPNFRMIYVGNVGNDTVSVVNGFSSNVAVGVKFKVNPVGSGTIRCGNQTYSQEYPTNKYIYIDEGTTCKAQGNNFFTFDRWLQDLGHNSSIPISDTSGNIIVNRYANFTANFIPTHQLTTGELFTYLTGAISAAVAINGALLVVPGWRRARNQRTHLKECIQMIDEDVGKSHKDAIEEKIIGYYVDGKLSEDHRQLLNDKISEYYGSVKDSESGT